MPWIAAWHSPLPRWWMLKLFGAFAMGTQMSRGDFAVRSVRGERDERGASQRSAVSMPFEGRGNGLRVWVWFSALLFCDWKAQSRSILLLLSGMKRRNISEREENTLLFCRCIISVIQKRWDDQIIALWMPLSEVLGQPKYEIRTTLPC